ncbi:hypothetical protein AKO1_007559 [Acrasis kona]|uniref:Aldehyde dehydrogenase domain-containing protein n=1 Tax=Acrasis kona TaxID=1008807 RepID=A0AAW2YS12_9EUKA
MLTSTPVPCLVDGVSFATNTTFDVVDPHNASKVLHRVCSVSTKEEVDKIIESSQSAFLRWKNTSIDERKAIFTRFIQLLEENADALIQTSVNETTASPPLATVDLKILGLDNLRSSISELSDALADRPLPQQTNGEHATIHRQPYGVIFAMTPWNMPIVLGIRSFTLPILAGNTVIMKTSEYSPQTHYMLSEILHRAGIPNGVLNVIHIRQQDAPQVVEDIISRRQVKKVNFTGSSRVGRIIAQVCGKHLKPSLLELGGKAPVIVLSDANLPKATSSILWGAFCHSGQICMSTEKVVVHHSVHKQLEQLIKEKLDDGKIIAAADGALFRGLFCHESANRFRGLIVDAINLGAKIVGGSFDANNTSNVVHPLVLTNVNPSMRIYYEETFGPVCIIIPFGQNRDSQELEDSEALDIANDTAYGLSASIYTSNHERGKALALEIDAGQVHVNGNTIHDVGTMPHGGWKESGWGRFNGAEGIKEWAQTKTITVNEPAQYPI